MITNKSNKSAKYRLPSMICIYLDISLEVVPLYRTENLSQSPGLNHIVLELDNQPLTQCNDGIFNSES